MSKIKDLAQTVGELKKAAEAVGNAAEWLEKQFSPGNSVEACEPVSEIRLEDVRAALTEKSRAGHTAEVKNLLKSHGAEKLSQIKPEMYGEILKEAEGIGP